MTKRKSINKAILIVEDEEPMLQDLVNKFNLEGFLVFEAKDGEEGLDLALKKHPDIILLDIVMPKMDGMTMMKKIREDKKWGKEVPVIILTNLSDPGNVSEAANFEVYDFLVKTDWRLDDVVRLVKQKLRLVS